MFGLGRPQPSSAEKIAAAEQEMDLVTDMFNKYAILPLLPLLPIHGKIMLIVVSQTPTSLHEEVHSPRIP
jgi:import inner membrane translocase subunit TIM10